MDLFGRGGDSIMEKKRMRLVVALTGASGSIYGIRLLQVLQQHPEVEVHLVISEAAVTTIESETDMTPKEVLDMADVVHSNRNMGASISSGSYKTAGMVIAPCSIKTLSAVAHSETENLIIRAADVTLKERRKLVLVVRETPFHLGHLRNMVRVTEMGGIILPPIPAFYFKPKTLDDIVNHTIGRVLDIFDVEHKLFERWKGIKNEQDR